MDEKLISEFIGQCAEISAKASAIADLAGNHFDTNPDAVTWFDVGSNDHTISLLDEILDFLHLTVDERTHEQ